MVYGININKEDVKKCLNKKYCCKTLSKCKNKKGYFCMNVLNKKTKICKIHKDTEKESSDLCNSRCISPEPKYKDNEKIHVDEVFIEEKDKDEKNNQNSYSHPLDLPQNNEQKVLSINIFEITNIIKKIINTDIFGLIEEDDVDDYKNIDITKFDNFMDMVIDVYGYGVIDKYTPFYKIIKSNINYFLNENNDIYYNDNYYFLNMLTTMYEIIKNVAIECPYF